MLTYNLRRVGENIGYPLTDWATRLVKEFEKAFEFGDEEEYGPNFTIAHLLDHKYAISHVVPTALKGQDARVFHALEQSNKFDLLLVPVQIERRGIGPEDEMNSSEAEEAVDEDWLAPIVETYAVDPSRPAHGSVHKQSFAVMTKSPLEGKRT